MSHVSDLLAPGDHRADGVLDDRAVLGAVLRVEQAWLAALVDHNVAPAGAALPAGRLAHLLADDDLGRLARAAEATGTPVAGLVALLRERLDAAGEPDAGRWLHRGLTSQDVVDTALVLGAAEAVRRVRAGLDDQLASLAALVAEHRDSPAAGRTLSRYAVPTTVGLRLAGHLAALLDVDAELAALQRAGWPLQAGGAAGTLAGLVELAGADRARAVLATTADQLGLVVVAPWHGRRRVLTRTGDALVAACDAWGHLASDVLSLGRPEVGELVEGAEPGRGGSSTMPGKANPVRAVLLRRTALAAPGHLATLHLAAAGQVEERADGAWHTEWPALRALARGAVAAAGTGADLLGVLVVHADVSGHRAREQAEVLLGERRSLRQVAGLEPVPDGDPGAYLGLAGDLVDDVLARAHAREPSHPDHHPDHRPDPRLEAR